MKLTPLTDCIGSEVEGVDLANTSAGERQKIKHALLDRGVLFFRKQSLNTEDQSKFVSAFANSTSHQSWMRSVGPNVYIVEAKPSESYNYSSGFVHWHQDSTFFTHYPHGSLLSAQHLPEIGGDTLWSSTYAAFEAFPESVKQMLLSLEALHDSTASKIYRLHPFMNTTENIESKTKTVFKHMPVTHPVVVKHPCTNKPCLFVNRVWTSKIIDIDLDLSESILKLCYDWIAKPRFQVRWKWNLGDVALYDNISTAHIALNDYTDSRLLYRSDFRYN